MNKKQYVQRNAASNTLVVLADNQDVVSGVAAIAVVKGDVQAKLGTIDEYAAQQERDRKGLTASKNAARIALVNVVVTVSGQLTSLGKRTGDADLRQLASEPRSSWMKVPQGKLVERAKGILALAQENREALVPFGTTDEVLTKLESAMAEFGAKLALPRDVINRRKTITGLVETEIKGLCTLLREELDPLVRQFEATHPQFYADYHNARALVDLPVIPLVKRQASRQAAVDKKAAKVKAKAGRKAASAGNGAVALNG